MDIQELKSHQKNTKLNRSFPKAQQMILMLLFDETTITLDVLNTGSKNFLIGTNQKLPPTIFSCSQISWHEFRETLKKSRSDLGLLTDVTTEEPNSLWSHD